MDNKLPETIERLRSQRGIKQKDLAAILHCSASSISNYEHGAYQPSLDTLSLLADFYGVSFDYLVGRSNRQYQDSIQKRVIYGKYTLGRFLRLLDTLPEEHLHNLVQFLRFLEKYCKS